MIVGLSLGADFLLPCNAGLFWLNLAQKPFLKDAQNTIGLLFFELLFLAFRTMFTALFTFPNEYKMVRSWLRLEMLHKKRTPGLCSAADTACYGAPVCVCHAV
jgi:hypothetical protein